MLLHNLEKMSFCESKFDNPQYNLDSDRNWVCAEFLK